MSGPSRRVIYDADTYRDSIEIVTCGINNICAVLPILDALHLTERWTPTQTQALVAIGVVVRDLADDIAHRAQLLARTGRGE